LGYYEIKKYNLNIKTHKNNLIAQGELALKALEGAPKYFGSIRSISVIQLAEELSKNENIKGIIIFTDDEILYKTKDLSNINSHPDPKTKMKESQDIITITKLLNPEDEVKPDLKNRLSANFFPIYYATVIISKKELNRFIDSSKKDIFLIFTTIIFVNILLIFMRYMIKKYQKLSIELAKAKQAEEIANLANILAHEIKNPLSSIKGFATYIYDKLEDEEIIDYIDKLLDEIDRLRKIVDDFNLFGKEIYLEKTQLSIKKLIEKTVSLLKYDANRKNVKILINGDNFDIFGDEHKILQVLINIILNAINASPENAEIQIDLLQKQIKVINQHNNKSINKEKLFTPFYTTNVTGSGLGLAICRKIMLAHHFDIYVEKTYPFVIVLDFDEQ
jgi:two-component system sensor histidine kinase HydH